MASNNKESLLDMDYSRVFISVPVQQHISQLIHEVINDLHKPDLSNIRPEATNNLHLTLKFLGNISKSDLPIIRKYLGTISTKQKTFCVTTGSLKCYPDSRNPRVIFLEIIDIDKKLLQLKTSIDQILVQNGFNQEPRPYSPHLTLARTNQGGNRYYNRQLTRFLKSVGQIKPQIITVNTLLLMESILYKDGAKHLKYASFQLSEVL